MKKKFEIITNNPLVLKELQGRCKVVYHENSYAEILTLVRDYIYKGHTLLSHPLSGSIKPNETPYKSIMVSCEAGELDFQSVEIIEKAIQACQKFAPRNITYKPEVYEDFQLIDKTLIESALPSAEAW